MTRKHGISIAAACLVIPEGVSAGVPGARVLRVPAAIVLPLFGATLFLSAFLMFLVEPLVAKMLLPVLGGSPMVWNTCVVFFQMMLLAGYGYAYGASRWLDVTRHRPLHLLLVAAPLTMIPFATHADLTPPAGNPVAWVLLVLVTVIGLPFFVLSTTASVLQHWFVRTDHASAHDPYFLYAASNVGSLAALAAYPTLVEPSLPLDTQSRWWAAGYAVFTVLICGCAMAIRRRSTGGSPMAAVVPAQAVDSIPAGRRVRWVVLSLLPASLMLGVTTYLSTDIAAVPLMWVVPMSLYLGTFVLAFSSAGRRAGAVAGRLAPVLLAALAASIASQARGPLTIIIPLHLAAFAALALRCHTTLAADRPSSTHLTEFYLWISVGGMLGGLFNTLLAPVLFQSVVEYPLALVLACACSAMAAIPPVRRAVIEALAFLLLFGLLTAGVTMLVQRTGGSQALLLAAVGLLSVGAFTQRRSPTRLAGGIAGLLIASTLFVDIHQPVLHAERTFFGVHRVVKNGNNEFHGLAHGTTLHGMQALDPALRHEPLTYYHRTGPSGQAFSGLPAANSGHDVAVIGLGAGSLAAYVRPNQRWTFYEIDAAVERIARTSSYFTYLNDCGDPCRVVLGDGRLALQRTSQMFDVIVLDAFSSDAVPMHLLTSEALSLYESRLAPGGVLLFHISNRHVALGPVLARLADNHRLVALEQVDLMTEQPQPRGKSQSDWVVMARMAADLGPLVQDRRWFTPHAETDTPLWTDDFSNILGVLRFR
jgi:hypothetical protein